MKPITITLLVISIFLCSCEKKQENNEPTKITGAVVTKSIETYKLYKTQNMWTFLKLDTSTGQIWQVQYSTEGDDYRFETPLNTTKLNKGGVNGRYELYPTDNMYNFIMLDVIDGNTYQVQWSGESENRFVIPIK